MINKTLIVNGAGTTEDLKGLEEIAQVYSESDRVILIDKNGRAKQIKYLIGEDTQDITYIEVLK